MAKSKKQTLHSDLISHFFGRPLAIDPEWLRQMIGELQDPRDLSALLFGYGSAVESVEVNDGIGVLSIRGPLLQNSYWHDYTDIREAFDHLLQDGSARAIVLDIDSPGGDVHSELNQLAAAILAARSEKPIHAIANESATSAAYFLASAAEKVHVTGSLSAVGSIGVIAMHRDRSEMLKQQGIAITEIVSGRHKNELSPNKPLSRSGREAIERVVELAFVDFAQAVSDSRGLAVDEIRSQEAAVFVGQDAINAGLADGLSTLDELVERLAEEARAGSGAFSTASATSADAEHQDREESQMAESTDTSAESTGAQAGTEGADVVNIEDARTQARRDQQEEDGARAEAIEQVCQLSGCPERAMSFYREGLSESAVRARILEDRANSGGDEVDGHQSTQAQVPSINLDAVYRRWNGAEAS